MGTWGALADSPLELGLRPLLAGQSAVNGWLEHMAHADRAAGRQAELTAA